MADLSRTGGDIGAPGGAHPSGGHPSRASGPPPRGKARAHSHLVRLLRFLLPMIMVVVVGALVVLVVAHAVRRRDAAHRDASTPIEMVNPHFFGRDSQGRAYTLGARQAARDEQSFQRVLLNYPSVTLDTEGPQPSNLTADKGVYHEDTRMLYLKGHVRANNAKQSNFASDEAIVNTRTGMVTSPTALSGETPVGDVQSHSFDVFDKGARVVFKGGVHARLNQH
jgi:lipopolysaccharide export system protein LptC